MTIDCLSNMKRWIYFLEGILQMRNLTVLIIFFGLSAAHTDLQAEVHHRGALSSIMHEGNISAVISLTHWPS